MARDGITCPSCGMVRAPTLARCPACRPEDRAEATRTESALDDAPPASITALPSRLVVALVPLLWIVLGWLVQTSEPWGSRPLGYVASGWVSAGLSLALGTPLLVLAFLGLGKLVRGVRVGGQVASPFAVGILVALGLGPLVYRGISRPLEAANVAGLEATPPELAECTWIEARQFRTREGALTHVAVTAQCALPDGTPFTADFDLDSASVTDAAHVTLPTWRGRYWGRLIAHDAYEVLRPDAGLEPVPVR